VSVGLAEEPPPVFILLPDPYTCPPEPLLAGLDRAYPQSAKVGGLVSGGAGGRNQALLLGNSVYRRGLVGVALAGDVAMDVVVAQGCRPVGAPMVITDCKENSLLRLNEIPPGKALETLYESLAPEDQKLFRTSLFVGVEADEHQVEYRESDVLVRNIVGMDPQTGAIAIGARPQRWQVVRFLLRDAAAARQDLRAQLGRYREVAGPAAAEAAGALLFSCLGRGKNLYGRSGHDSEVFREFIGAVPLAGFFCNGEIGPVRGTTYLHGYTSAFGILRPRSRTPARRPARG
jgi:small ligand-binding sensory domain FIST